MKLLVIKLITYPLVYFSICFILASGFGSAFSGMFDPVPEDYLSYGNYFDGFIIGLAMGATIGFFLYGIVFGISAFIYSLMPQKFSSILKFIFLGFTIIFGYLSGSIFATGLAI